VDNLSDSKSTSVVEGEELSARWKHLSPLSSIYYLLKTLSGLISNALPSLAPLFILYVSSDNRASMLNYILVGVSVMLLLSALAQYWFFKYQILDTEILLKQGILKRQQRVIKFDRIQNISINYPVYFRPFKLVTLVIETAGSKSGEGDLAGIPTETAIRIRDNILQHQKQLKAGQGAHVSSTTEDFSDTYVKGEPIATASIGDIIRYGLSNNGMYILLAFMAPFSNRLKDVFDYVFTPEQIQEFMLLFVGKMIAGIVIFLLSIIVILLLLTLISVIGAMLKFYNYRLTLSDGTLKRESGLINTHEESLNLSKVQAISRSSNFIGKWLGCENLICRKTSGSGNNHQKSGNAFVVPARTKKQCEKLIQLIYPDFETEMVSHNINRRYIFKTWLLSSVLPILMLSLPFIYNGIYVLFFLWLLPILSYPMVVKRWRKFSYGKTEEYGLITSGFIGHKKVLFPFFKVQRAEITQSPVQRRRNLANLTIYLASGPLQIPYMPIDHAREWFDWIYAKSETDKRPWF
jgi:putative membrane protein